MNLSYVLSALKSCDPGARDKLLARVRAEGAGLFEPLYNHLDGLRAHFHRGTDENEVIRRRLTSVLREVWPTEFRRAEAKNRTRTIALKVWFMEDVDFEDSHVLEEDSPFLFSSRVEVIDLTTGEEYEDSQGRYSMVALTEVDLAPLNECSRLHTLILTNNAFQRVDLSPLDQCPNLRVLRVANNLLAQIDLTPLQSCRQLVELDLSGTDEELRFVDISPLFSCPLLAILKIDSDVEIYANPALKERKDVPQGVGALRERILWDVPAGTLRLPPRLRAPAEGERANLSNKGLQVVNLAPLVQRPGLQQIDLSGNLLEQVDLSPLRRCSSLRILYLLGNVLQSLDLTPLEGCANLEELRLGANKYQSINLAPLVHCKKLRVLDLGNALVKVDLSPLAGLALEQLSIHNSPLVHLNLDPLQYCAGLRMLFLSLNQLTELDLGPLQHCPNLTELYLEGNLLSSIDFAPLQHCSNLSKLVLTAHRFTNVDLGPLRYSANLLRLGLGGTAPWKMDPSSHWVHEGPGLPTVDLGPLGACSRLEELDLGRNHLREIDLTPLAACQSLRLLRLDNNDLTELDLTPLGHCQRLEHIDLQRNPLPRVDVSPLFGCPKLEFVESYVGLDAPIEMEADVGLRDRPMPSRFFSRWKYHPNFRWHAS